PTSPRATASAESRLPCVTLVFLGAFVLLAPQLLHLATGGSEYYAVDAYNAVEVTIPADQLWNEAMSTSCTVGGLIILAPALVGLATGSQMVRAPVLAAGWALVVPAALWWWLDFDLRERQVRQFSAVVLAEGAPGDP